MTMKHVPRVMIAGASSGSGKTMITCGLLSWLKNCGKNINSYKCGPDYIDPMFHKKIIGIPSTNLDSFFSAQQDIRNIVGQSECALIEGVMGIYDGLGGIELATSSYEVAMGSSTPIILVVDGHGCGRTLFSIIRGIIEDDYEQLIKGIIINKIPGSFFEMLKPGLEKTLSDTNRNITILGYLPKINDLSIESRHLGLIMPDEIHDYQNQIRILEENIRDSINLDKLEQIMNSAPSMEVALEEKIEKHTTLRLGIAMDEAFCFYYEENLSAFRKRGVEIVPFSPLHNQELPEKIDGLLLGGGYPELYLDKLGNNISMRDSIKNAIDYGLPSLAECGGFMYLHEFIKDEQGADYPMVGAVQGVCEKKSRLVRFGYIELSNGIKGHEFHYYDSSNNGSDLVATKPVSNRKWECMHMGENHAWGYPHLYYGSNPSFVDWFVDCMSSFAQCRIGNIKS